MWEWFYLQDAYLSKEKNIFLSQKFLHVSGKTSGLAKPSDLPIWLTIGETGPEARSPGEFYIGPTKTCGYMNILILRSVVCIFP